MASLFGVTAKSVTVVNGIKIPVAIATGSTIQNKWVAIDITFEGTSATAKPLLVELVKTTAAPSGGSTYTPNKLNQETRVVAISTARVNDTTDGSSPTIIKSWYVPYTAGVLQQLPLGREFGMNPSEFYEIRITQVSGETAVNYACNVDFEE